MKNYYIDYQLLSSFRDRNISKELELELLIQLHGKKYTYVYLDDLSLKSRLELQKLIRAT